jgi:cobaltochelatase CobT
MSLLEDRTHARLQQQVEEFCAAVIRALIGEADLHFRARRLHRGGRPLPMYAAHLHPRLGHDDQRSFRGAADGLALRLLRSDPALHRDLCPAEPMARLLFESLEQLRVESLVPAGMPGVAHNLRHRFEAWSLGFHHAGQTENARGLLVYTLLQICRSRLTGDAVVEETEDLLESTRAAIGPMIGSDLAGLKRERANQAAYARHARSIALRMAALLLEGGDESAPAPPSGADPDDERSAFSLVMQIDSTLPAAQASAAAGRSRVLEADAGVYRVYSAAYDRERLARAGLRPQSLHEHRARLDARIAGQGVNLHRLVRELRAVLAQPRREGWDDAQEVGVVDGRRLAGLIANPGERRLFRSERTEARADAVVTFLIDCSGSMKEHVESVAMLVDVLVRALEQAGVASEVLGYSTGAWNGGRAARDWQRAGRPPHPGRLNERLHLVFKDADTPWRRARAGIAALFEASLFREGLDGEALDWACQRLLERGEEHKLLFAISDGAPMDAATSLANDPQYLDQHLRDIVGRHERAGQLRLHGLGVGLDLSPYYGNSRVLALDMGSGHQPFGEVVELIAGRHRR